VYGPRMARPLIMVTENALAETRRKGIFEFLNQSGWQFGWKSDPKADPYSFWHKHFAGSIHPDHFVKEGRGRQYACAEELLRNAPLIYEMWQHLQETALSGHVLTRCYANGHAFGSDGSVHTDSLADRSFTSVYYPHEKWDPNWGGETVLFNKDKSDTIASIYPRPNRLATFRGTIPHVARGVSRVCPVMRITLMFKTEVSED
jgi:SM-20-related protein